MVDRHKHVFETLEATPEKPYHFVDSGLPNAYLIGVDYRVCKECGAQSADIPAVKSLMTVIAREIVSKESTLTGEEIRFLRKRLGKSAADFGRIIGPTQEQVSRWENNHNPPSESADKLIRVFYCHLSGDPVLRQKINRHIEEWLSTLPGEERIDSFRAKLHKREWTAETVPST
jgi:putative zinc finger/helix-turn-helix YgiT family protein